jgi:Flp pilus assembly protein TadD
MLCYRAQRWAECFGAALTALDIKDRAKVYTVDPAVWGAQPHDLAAVSAWNLGLHDQARRHGADALALDPNDQRLRHNVVVMAES